MDRADKLINIILKALAMAMAAASVVIGYLGGATAESLITLLGIGLFALAVAALREQASSRESD
jgi:hypothetical protein